MLISMEIKNITDFSIRNNFAELQDLPGKEFSFNTLPR